MLANKNSTYQDKTLATLKEHHLKINKLDILPPQAIDGICTFLEIFEIEELCLVNKTLRNKVYSISKIKIRVLEAKVENTKQKLQVIYTIKYS